MVNAFRVGSTSAGHAPDENDRAATSIAAPELAAEYFRRLRRYNIAAVAGFLLLFTVGIPLVYLDGWLWRTGAALLLFAMAVGVRLAGSYYFRCPACEYEFQTGPYFTEPKWHACPNCHTQFTAERKLRWPAL